MFDIVCKFHVASDSPLRDASNALDSLRPYATWLGDHDHTLKRWWLGGERLEGARQYEAFAEGANGHAAAKAVLAAEFKNSRAPVVFLWNGEDDSKAGASLVLSVTETTYPSKIELALDGSAASPRQGLSNYSTVAKLVSMLARDTKAECCFVYRQTAYGRRMPSMDRPGVGWMLYLPRVFTSKDLPEARALVPVMDSQNQQIGTIIVSVVDAVFSARNNEHVRVARELETRLVSNDWLPTWADMIRLAGTP